VLFKYITYYNKGKDVPVLNEVLCHEDVRIHCYIKHHAMKAYWGVEV